MSNTRQKHAFNLAKPIILTASLILFSPIFGLLNVATAVQPASDAGGFSDFAETFTAKPTEPSDGTF
jgi:hypothetical protein